MGQQQQRGQQRVHAHFLRIPDVKGRDSQQEGRQQASSRAIQPTADLVDKRHAGGTPKDGKQAKDNCVCADFAPEPHDRIIKRHLVANAHQVAQHFGKGQGGAFPRFKLVPPQVLVGQANQPQGEGQE
jgi:hypothetical protein